MRFALLQFKDTSISEHIVKDHFEQAVLNQYVARHWASRFRDEIQGLMESKMVKMEDLMGMPNSLNLKPVLIPSLAFEFTTLHMIGVIPHRRNPSNLASYTNTKYLLMSPYLEGGKFEKISGDTGEISPDWRGQGIKLTRTLDAFQHFVVAKSDENLLIADLQGKTQTKLFITLLIQIFRNDNSSKAEKQYRGYVYASGSPAPQVLSN